jgi:hypothetical protein
MFAPGRDGRVLTRCAVAVQQRLSIAEVFGCIAAAVVCSGAVATPAHAQELVPVHVDYRAVSECPDESRFFLRLHAHTQRLSRSNDPQALQLDVVVVRRGDGFVGRLVVTQGTEALGSRQFEDANCAEVVAALALSAALSVDPEAKIDARTELEADGSDATSREPEPPTESAPETPPSEFPRSDATAIVPSPEPPDEDERQSETRTWIISVGPEVAVGFAFDPKAALGGGLSVGLHRLPDRAWFPIEGSISFDYMTTRPVRGSDPIRMDWYTFRLGYCPLRTGNEWALLACSVGYGGWISAQGVAVDAPRTVRRGFATVGLGLRGRASFGAGWVLQADLDLSVPLSERSFAVNSEQGPQPELDVVAASRPVGVLFAVGVRRAF